MNICLSLQYILIQHTYLYGFLQHYFSTKLTPWIKIMERILHKQEHFDLYNFCHKIDMENFSRNHRGSDQCVRGRQIFARKVYCTQNIQMSGDYE